MVERACLDIHSFKKAIRALPQTEVERRMNGWVVEAAQLLTNRQGYSPGRARKPGKIAGKGKKAA